MKAMLDFLNQNSGAFTVLFSLVVACATVFYAVLTYRLVDETRRMREVQTEPALVVSIEPSEHWINFINLVIANVGEGPARDITLRATPDFQRFAGRYVSALGMFKHGIKHLSPGQRITVFLTSMVDAVHGTSSDLGHLNFEISASYRSPDGRVIDDSFPIHFDSLEGMGNIGTPPLIDIAQSIEKIQRDVQHVVSGFRKLEVVVHTREDVARDNTRTHERLHPLELLPDPVQPSSPTSGAVG